MTDRPIADLRRFEQYVKWSFYVVLGLPVLGVPLALLGATRPAEPLEWAVYVVSSVGSPILLVLSAIAAHRGFDRVMGRPGRLRTWFVVLWAVVALCVLVSTTIGSTWNVVWGGPGLVIGMVAATVCITLTARQAGLVALVGLVLILPVGFVIAAAPDDPAMQGLGTTAVVVVVMDMLLALFYIGAGWSSGWARASSRRPVSSC